MAVIRVGASNTSMIKKLNWSQTKQNDEQQSKWMDPPLSCSNHLDLDDIVAELKFAQCLQ